MVAIIIFTISFAVAVGILARWALRVDERLRLLEEDKEKRAAAGERL